MSIDEGQSIYVPLNNEHRLKNKSASPLLLIEVQLVRYLGEIIFLDMKINTHEWKITTRP